MNDQALTLLVPKNKLVKKEIKVAFFGEIKEILKAWDTPEYLAISFIVHPKTFFAGFENDNVNFETLTLIPATDAELMELRETKVFPYVTSVLYSGSAYHIFIRFDKQKEGIKNENKSYNNRVN